MFVQRKNHRQLLWERRKKPHTNSKTSELKSAIWILWLREESDQKPNTTTLAPWRIWDIVKVRRNCQNIVECLGRLVLRSKQRGFHYQGKTMLQSSKLAYQQPVCCCFDLIFMTVRMCVASYHLHNCEFVWDLFQSCFATKRLQ